VTTISELAKRHAEIAYVLEIEGCEYAFTDNDPTGIGALWAASGYTVKGGLLRPSASTQEIDLLEFKITPSSMSFQLVDISGILGTLFADQKTATLFTYLTEALTRTATSCKVRNAASFPASGTIHIGAERITYTGKTATSFTGLTRGTLPWANKTKWAHAFEQGESGIGAEVTTDPTIWRGRGVMLRIVARDASSGSWNTRANSVLVFAGTLAESWQYSAGTYSLNADSVENLMAGKLLSDQYSATISWIQIGTAELIGLVETPGKLDESGYTLHQSSITVDAGSYTLSTLIEAINVELAAKRAKRAGDIQQHWSLQILATDDKTARVRLMVKNNSGAALGIHVDAQMKFFGKAVCKILGIEQKYAVVENIDGADGFWYTDFLTTPKTVWIDGFSKTLTVDETSEVGTWHNQRPSDIPASLWADGARGFVLLGESVVWAVSYSGGTITKYAEWWWKTEVTPDTKMPGMNLGCMIPGICAEGWVANGVQALKEDFGSETSSLQIRQVWIAGGTVCSLLLKLLMSTGSYNHNSLFTDMALPGALVWDAWPASMGCGIPSTLIDVGSFQAVSAASGASAVQKLVLFKEEDAAVEITSLIGSIGAHLVWHSGKIRAIMPTTLESLPTDYEIDSYSIGLDDVQCDNATDLVRNTCSLRYNRNPVNDEYLSRPVTYVDAASNSIYGTKNELTFEARSLYDFDGSATKAWLSNIAAPLCAYWSRSMRRYTITGAPGLYGICVGDIVEFTCDDPPDPTTGTYGLEGVRGWVIALSYSHEEQLYDSITILVPTMRAYQMGPAAKLDADATEGGYVEDESPMSNGYFSLWTELHEFSLSSESIDAASFRVGDWCYLTEADPEYVDSASILWWEFEIVGVDTATGEISCYGEIPFPEAARILTGYTSAKEYYLGLGLHSEQSATRMEGQAYFYASIADEDTDLVESLESACNFGAFRPKDVDEDGYNPDASSGVYRPMDFYYTDGMPYSVAFLRDLANTINAFWQYGQLQQVFGIALAEIELGAYEEYSASTIALMSTPIRIPFGVSSLTVAVFYGQSLNINTLNCRLTISPSPGPDADGNWVGEYSQGEFFVDVGASETSEVWTTSLDGIRSVNGWAYLTLEAYQSSDDAFMIHGVYAYANPRELLP